MVELLKQGQYQPLDIVDQVLSIYAGTRGHLDDVKRDEVAAWEAGFLTFVRDQTPEVRSRLEETKALDDETERLIEAAIAEYKRQIQGSKKHEPTLAGTT
jgi:F-type H+-transporting ATPase subunit alpha